MMKELYEWNSSNCPNLPSAHAVCNVMNGNPEGWSQVIKGTLARAGLIGAGLFLFAGERDPRRLVTHSLAGATAIEIAVVRFLWTQRSTPSAQIEGPTEPVAVEFSEERSPAMYGAYEFTPDPTHIREALLNEGESLLSAPLPVVGLTPVQLAGVTAFGLAFSYGARAYANSKQDEAAHQTAMLVGGTALYVAGAVLYTAYSNYMGSESL